MKFVTKTSAPIDPNNRLKTALMGNFPKDIIKLIKHTIALAESKDHLLKSALDMPPARESDTLKAKEYVIHMQKNLLLILKLMSKFYSNIGGKSSTSKTNVHKYCVEFIKENERAINENKVTIKEIDAALKFAKNKKVSSEYSKNFINRAIKSNGITINLLLIMQKLLKLILSG